MSESRGGGAFCLRGRIRDIQYVREVGLVRYPSVGINLGGHVHDELLRHESRVNQDLNPATDAVQHAEEVRPCRQRIFALLPSFVVFRIQRGTITEDYLLRIRLSQILLPLVPIKIGSSCSSSTKQLTFKIG